MDKITAVGLDLAKQIIQVHAIDVRGQVVLRKAVRLNVRYSAAWTFIQVKVTECYDRY